MEGDAPPYQLSSTLEAHQGDVRCVAGLRRDVWVTGSRDGTLRVWRDRQPCLPARSVHAPAYVQCVARASADEFVSGGADRRVARHHLDAVRPPQVWPAHDDVVCAITALQQPDGYMTGSWDQTARLWRSDGGLQAVLRGHQAAVWAVLQLSAEVVVTASADRTVRLWNRASGACLQVLRAHTDAVRALVRLHPDLLPPGTSTAEAFASTGNDGDVLLWSSDGQLQRRLSRVHDSFVYAAACQGEWLATVSEDRTLKISNWRRGQVVQTVPHPDTVWCVAFVPDADGDCLTGCADGRARLWTRVPGRVAPPAELAAWEDSLARQTMARQQVEQEQPSSIDWAALPPMEQALAVPGTRDGQTRLVRASGGVQVYMWSAAQHKWLKTGDVVDQRGQPLGASTAGNGNAGLSGYDYVFEVDVDDERDGSGPATAPDPQHPRRRRQLGFRRGEDPYEAATRFLEREQLPSAYLSQVVEFLTRNVPAADLGTSVAGTASDPLTGDSRYIPDDSSSSCATFTPILFPSTDSYARLWQHLPEAYRTPPLSPTAYRPWSTERLEHVARMVSELDAGRAAAAVDLARLAVVEPAGAQRFLVADDGAALQRCLALAHAPDAPVAVRVFVCRLLCNAFAHQHTPAISDALLRAYPRVMQALADTVMTATPPDAAGAAGKLRDTFYALWFNYAGLTQRLQRSDARAGDIADDVLQRAVQAMKADDGDHTAATTRLQSVVQSLLTDAHRAQLAVSAGLLECPQLPPSVQDTLTRWLS